MKNEIVWYPIDGYSDYYIVSSLGCVRSLDRKIVSISGQTRNIKGRTLTPKNNGVGYHFVTLSKNGNTRNHYVHRLVAKAFIPNADNKKYVNHIDGNRTNNRVDNLEWITHSDNVLHAYKNNLNSNKGGHHTNAIGVVDNTLGQSFNTIKEWCAAKGLNYSTGRNVLNGYSKMPKSINLTNYSIKKLYRNENATNT